MSFDNNSPSSSDIRSASRDHQRDVEHRHKWSRGAAPSKGRSLLDLNHQKPAPRAMHSHSIVPKLDRHAYAKSRDSCKSKEARKADMLSANDRSYRDHDTDTLIVDHDDSNSSAPVSAEEDNATDATQPQPLPLSDDGVMYSYDSARSPNTGSQILSAVLDQALERYQDRETMQMVHDEYELVDADGESLSVRSSGRKGRHRLVKKSTPAKEDDDYEMV